MNGQTMKLVHYLNRQEAKEGWSSATDTNQQSLETTLDNPCFQIYLLPYYIVGENSM